MQPAQIHTVIVFASCVLLTHHKLIKSFVSLSRRLLQSVQRFVQFTNPIFFTSNSESIWLRHIDFLLQVTVQERGFYIKLSQLQIQLCYQGQQNSNRGMFNNWRKYLIIINSLLLSVAFSYQSCLVADIILLGKSFFLCKYPFASNCLLSFWQLCQLSCVVLLKGLHLFIHCTSPSTIF